MSAMDADLTSCVHLINGLCTHLGKDEPLTASFCRHACGALSRPLFLATAGPGTKQQQSTVAESCSRLLDRVAQLVTKGSLTEQSLAVQLLAACIAACDSVSLLERAAGWGTQLTEAIRRASSAAAVAATTGPSDGPSSTAPAAPGGAVALAEAACLAAAVMFSRVQQHIELPGVRREVTSIVPKLLPQLLPVLQNTHLPSSCQTAALQLLAALLQCTPNALRSTAAALLRTLQQIVVRAASSTGGSGVLPAFIAARQQVLAQAAVCIALLPAVPGDAASWSEVARRLLSSSHDILDHLLMGLEGRPVDPQYRAYLAPAGADGQPSQQQQQQANTAAGGWIPNFPWQQQQQQEGPAAANRRQTVPAKLLLGVCISALQQLLQQPFAVPVPIPGYALALLAARLLQFDAGAAVAAGAVAGSSTMYQELLVLQPQLQQAGWQLLQLVAHSVGHQLQLQGLLLRLARQGLRSVQISGRAALQLRPVAVRCCMYATATQLLRAAGLAGVRALAVEAMGCAVLELYGQTGGAAGGSGMQFSGSKGSAGQRPSKRAKTSGGGNEFEQFDPAASVAAVAGDEAARLATAADLAAQASALQLLQQLLEAGGQLLPAEVRAHADAVVFHIAQTAAAAALRLQQQPALSMAASSSDLGSLQVAAYQALLASILVPCSSHRAPFLSQALLLFRQGRSSPNHGVAAVCQAAAVQCEALLHPRAAAMSSVRQYAGMEAVPPLSKPRMWSAVDAAVGKAGLPSSGAAAGDAAAAQTGGAAGAAGAGQQQQADSGAGIAAAAAGGARMSSAANVVIGYPVNTGSNQQQQQPHVAAGNSLHRPSEIIQAGRAGGAGSAAAAAGPNGAVDSLGGANVVAQQVQQHRQQGVVNHQQPAAPIFANGPAAGSSIAAAGGAAGSAAAGVQAGQAAAAASTAGSSLKQRPAAHVFDAESSDSEGPLPEIDSGSESSEDGGGNRFM